MRVNSARSPARAAATDARARFCSWRFGSLSFSYSHRNVDIADRNAPASRAACANASARPSRSRGGPSDSSTSSVSSETGDASSVRSAMSMIATDAGSFSTSLCARRAKHLACLREQRPAPPRARVRLHLLEGDVASDLVVAVRGRTQHRDRVVRLAGCHQPLRE